MILVKLDIFTKPNRYVMVVPGIVWVGMYGVKLNVMFPTATYFDVVCTRVSKSCNVMVAVSNSEAVV